MSRYLGGKTGHQTPGAFSVVPGQVQLLLQLGIDRFAAQTQAVELLLSRRRAFWSLVGFGRSQQLQRAVLLQIVLKGGVIVGSISKQPLEVMGKRVEQFDHGLIVVAVRRSEQEAHNEAAQTDHTMQLAAKVLQGLAETRAIVGTADKIAGPFAPLVAHARHRSRVNGCRLSNAKASSTSCKLRRTARITDQRSRLRRL